MGILGDKKNFTSFHSGKVFKHFLCAGHCAGWWPLKAKWGMISTAEEKELWREEEAFWRLCLTQSGNAGGGRGGTRGKVDGPQPAPSIVGLNPQGQEDIVRGVAGRPLGRDSHAHFHPILSIPTPLCLHITSPGHLLWPLLCPPCDRALPQS